MWWSGVVLKYVCVLLGKVYFIWKIRRGFEWVRFWLFLILSWVIDSIFVIVLIVLEGRRLCW